MRQTASLTSWSETYLSGFKPLTCSTHMLTNWRNNRATQFQSPVYWTVSIFSITLCSIESKQEVYLQHLGYLKKGILVGLAWKANMSPWLRSGYSCARNCARCLLQISSCHLPVRLLCPLNCLRWPAVHREAIVCHPGSLGLQQLCSELFTIMSSFASFHHVEKGWIINDCSSEDFFCFYYYFGKMLRPWTLCILKLPGTQCPWGKNNFCYHCQGYSQGLFIYFHLVLFAFGDCIFSTHQKIVCHLKIVSLNSFRNVSSRVREGPLALLLNSCVGNGSSRDVPFSVLLLFSFLLLSLRTPLV